MNIGVSARRCLGRTGLLGLAGPLLSRPRLDQSLESQSVYRVDTPFDRSATKVFSFRGSLIIAASVLLLAVVVAEHGGQMPGNPEPKTPAAEQERSGSPQSPTAPNSLTEPKHVRTTTIRTDRASEKWLELPGSSTAPNSLTEPKPVRTTTIRTDRANEKWLESPGSSTAPNSLTEPKRVRTTTIRTDRAEEKFIESPGSSMVPKSLTEP